MHGTADQPVPFATRAADHVPIRGFLWRHADPDPARPVVVINAATSVRCRYYSRFAAWLHGHGRDVVTYDYRGIGESRPTSLRGFDADWVDWGQLDCEAALAFAAEACPGQPVDMVAHSIGGFAAGLAPSARHLRRIVTVGAQFAHWRDYLPAQRLGMVVKWHLFMPAVAALAGYFPGKRLGWLEDTPRGVVRDWSRMPPRFEARLRRGRLVDGLPEGQALVRRFAAVTAPILAISLTDDPFGTVPAIERLLAYFRQAERTHLRLAPHDAGVAEIGHFAFFHARFAATLWPLALSWLEGATLPPDAPGTVVRRMPAEHQGTW